MRIPAVILATLLVAMAAQAREKNEAATEPTKRTVAMSERVFKKLQQAQKHVEAQEYTQAHQVLEAIQQLKGLSEYEKAQIWNLTAYTWYLQKNYQESIRAYEKMLNFEQLPEALVQSTLQTLAQLYFTEEDYNKALTTVQKLIRVTVEPAGHIYMLLGQSHYQLRQYREAIAPIEKAIALQRQHGKEAKENQLLLLRAIYYELKDYKAMLHVLDELIHLYPNDQYILTLAGIYSELGDTEKQLTLIEALYERGVLDAGRHALNLANLYLLHELPYKAAQILEKEMQNKNIKRNVRNLKLLSQAWYQAREDAKSISPLRQAAAKSDTGELYVRLAQAYTNLGHWQDAAGALQEALQRGG